MTRTRGTSKRGVGHGARKNLTSGEKEKTTNNGYKDNVSVPVRRLVDNWESRSVAEILAFGSQGTQVNYYWLMKNMPGTLVEEMLTNWNLAKVAIMDTRANMAHLDGILAALEANLTDRRYSLFPHLVPPPNYGPTGHFDGFADDLAIHIEGVATVANAQATGNIKH